MYAKLNILPALLALLALGSAAQADDTLQSRVDETIRPLMAAHAIAGMAVAIPASAALTWFDAVIDRIRRDVEDGATRLFVSEQPSKIRLAAE